MKSFALLKNGHQSQNSNNKTLVAHLVEKQQPKHLHTFRLMARKHGLKRKSVTVKSKSELRTSLCVIRKAEIAVLGSPSLMIMIVLMVSVDVSRKYYQKEELRYISMPF